jgi:hypothetical protein
MEVRRRNCGVDGKPILFYAARGKVAVPLAKRPSKPKHNGEQYAEILAGVRSLGLTATTAAQVAAAFQEEFPGGLAGVEPGEAVRSVFLCIKRKNSSDNVG